MGMDVYGKNPTAEVGKYFRNNVWWWHPLWDYARLVAPTVTAPVTCGHSNDGDGLDGDMARDLAARLQAEIASGRCAAYAEGRAKMLAGMPLESCDICGGTGQRLWEKGAPVQPPPSDELGTALHEAQTAVEALATSLGLRETADEPEIKPCNACEGKGERARFETHYPFSVENVQEFAAFLEACGGFEIC